MNILSERFDDVADRFIVTTDKCSNLWEKMEKENITLLSIPENVGGRYSVFSSVGILPLALAGVDVEMLLKGAMDMRNKCLNEEMIDNPAVVSALILFLNLKKNKVINDNFFFNSELEALGKWYRQLMGESLGKDEKGITPTVSVGSVDLHSVGQLYVGGVKNKIFSFIKSNGDSGVDIPSGIFSDLLKDTKGKSSADILDAIFEGVTTVYSKNKIPFVEIILNGVSPKTIGEFMQFKMMEMVYLGALLGVNPFNQPDVEAYKSETKRILSK
jgi:glucose-6-phosphate isomerase